MLPTVIAPEESESRASGVRFGLVGRLVKLLVLAGLLYFAWTEGWPWLQGELESLGATRSDVSSMQSEAGRCVAGAEAARRAFGEGFRGATTRRGDHSEWLRFSGRIQSRIRDARSACRCPEDACELADGAMRELERNLHELDGMIRGSVDRFSNPAARLEEVDQLLAEARSEL